MLVLVLLEVVVEVAAVVVLDWQRRHDGVEDDNFRLLIGVDAVAAVAAVAVAVSIQMIPLIRSNIKAVIALIPLLDDDDDCTLDGNDDVILWQ